ncbi:DUF29 domain-containing protein [Parathermosynechococcus lividus]|nr:DUF29 domain-containing protein [Synechococcus sp. PCC 6716]
MHSETVKSEVKTQLASLYETDYQCWLNATVAQLKVRDFDNLDLENLIEEIESLGKSEKRAISSYLMRLCEHFLKLKYWESERKNCFRSWKLEVANFRLKIQAILKDSPSLKNYLSENFDLEYRNGRKLFLNASELNANMIPQEPEFTLEQALDEDWLPWQPE